MTVSVSMRIRNISISAVGESKHKFYVYLSFSENLGVLMIYYGKIRYRQIGQN